MRDNHSISKLTPRIDDVFSELAPDFRKVYRGPFEPLRRFGCLAQEFVAGFFWGFLIFLWAVVVHNVLRPAGAYIGNDILFSLVCTAIPVASAAFAYHLAKGHILTKIVNRYSVNDRKSLAFEVLRIA